ncbi:serine/threonine protein kinase [Bifidobacterium tissieri]|uniref:Serine/threonine protein kinase n=1 Tax=Bifidobacterium tissieri TaxID=1630162 RepID=A0A261FHM0_9BIFI|nr:protein kinase family protein [Bifidobacterium tissieri]OZG58463.1 serine/threonine protein kinase [Bifidobacterium tissieri]
MLSRIVVVVSSTFGLLLDLLDDLRSRAFARLPVPGRSNHSIGEYRVIRRLGGGRYGVCLLAESSDGSDGSANSGGVDGSDDSDGSDGRRVVLKRFRRRMHKRNAGNNHYEAVILSGLSHPSVPELLGVINDRSGYYFVLSCQPGITLKTWLFDRHKSFSRAEIHRIGTQMFDVLTYIHSRSVIHGDISLSNIMDDGERVSLIDFGLARYMSDMSDSSGIGMGIDIDHARFADVLLYLMYSCDGLERQSGRARGTAWYDELDLTAPQMQCLKRLIGIGRPYGSTPEAAEAFRSAFASWA